MSTQFLSISSSLLSVLAVSYSGAINADFLRKKHTHTLVSYAHIIWVLGFLQ